MLWYNFFMISEKIILENCNNVLKNINDTAQLIGRDISEIKVLGVTKTVPIDNVMYVFNNTPINVFGENRAQELINKYNPDIEWHFIGQLQSNKVKYIIDKVSLIHSLDRLSLASEINKQAKKHNIIANVLIEINIAGEESKGGIKPEQLFSFIEQVAQFENICIKGLMAVMPNILGEELESHYLKLNKLYTKLLKANIKNTDIKYLSAGMSNDYKIALKYGANILRIGRAIFGER